MKRLAALAAVVVGAWALAGSPDEEAHACSIYCPEGTVDFELVEVRLVELPQEASRGDLPAVPEYGSLNAWGSMWFEDGSYLYVQPEEVTE